MDASLKDRIRISLICATSMVSILFRDTWIYGLSKLFTQIPQNGDMYNFISNVCTNTFLLIEPICLLLLCKEFRRNFLRQFLCLPFSRKFIGNLQSSTMAAATTRINQSSQIIRIAPSRNNSSRVNIKASTLSVPISIQFDRRTNSTY